MKGRQLPWIVAAIALIAFVASFSELQRMRRRFGEVTRPVLFHVHADVRRGIIAQQLARADKPVMVLGDSLVEAATLPETICGHAVVNAGIGGATMTDFRMTGVDFMRQAKPALTLIAIGMNDGLATNPMFDRDMRSFVQSVRQISPVAVFGLTKTEPGILVDHSAEVNRTIDAENAAYAAFMASTNGSFFPAPSPTGSTIDGVHLGPVAYQRWRDALTDAVKSSLGCTGSGAGVQQTVGN